MYLPLGIILENNVAPLPKWVAGGWGVWGVPVGGYVGEEMGWLLCWLALECWWCLVEVGPICAVVGIYPGFCWGGVLDTDEHGFLDSPGLAVYFFVDNVELVGVHGVSCGGAVKMYGGGCLEMFFNPFPQGPARFPYVGTGAVDVGALVLVNDAFLVGFGILILGIAQSCPEGVGTLEVDLDTSSFAKFLEFVCCFGMVGDYLWWSCSCCCWEGCC